MDQADGGIDKVNTAALTLGGEFDKRVGFFTLLTRRCRLEQFFFGALGGEFGAEALDLTL
jgi:hypothetical protein